MEKNELYRLIDCCRPGQCDLAEAEMSALAAALEQDAELRAAWESRQAWNVVVGEAIRDVPVPSGLSQRIIGNLESSRIADQDEVEAGSIGQSGGVSGAGSDSPRRWFQVGTVAIVAAAATVALIVWLGPWRQSINGVQVAEMARAWVTDLDAEAWRVKSPPVKQYPPSDPSLRFRVDRWQTFEALGDANAVAYLTEMPPDRSAGFLLVIRTGQGRSLPAYPPSIPDSTTEGWCLGAWKNAGLLYVLVVPGSQQQYQRMLRPQSFAQLDLPAVAPSLRNGNGIVNPPPVSNQLSNSVSHRIGPVAECPGGTPHFARI